jgi:hypothetical protein
MTEKENVQAALVIRGFDYLRTQKVQITRETAIFSLYHPNLGLKCQICNSRFEIFQELNHHE